MKKLLIGTLLSSVLTVGAIAGTQDTTNGGANYIAPIDGGGGGIIAPQPISNRTASATFEGRVLAVKKIGNNNLEILLENVRYPKVTNGTVKPETKRMTMVVRFSTNTKWIQPDNSNISVDADNIKTVADKYVKVGETVKVSGALLAETGAKTVRDRKSDLYIQARKLDIIPPIFYAL